MPITITYEGPGLGERIKTFSDDTNRIVIGRSDEADVQFPEDASIVGREHCAIERRPDGYYYLIMNKDHQVFVDGKPAYSAMEIPRSCELRLRTADGPRLTLVIVPDLIASSQITISSDWGGSRTFVNDSILIGRSIEADLEIPAEQSMVGHRHCVLERRVGGYSLAAYEDRPVYIDGKPAYNGTEIPRSCELRLGMPNGPRLTLVIVSEALVFSSAPQPMKQRLMKPAWEIVTEASSYLLAPVVLIGEGVSRMAKRWKRARAADVDCSIFAPTEARPSDTVLVQAVLHPRGASQQAFRLARLGDTAAESRGTFAIESEISEGNEVEVRLRSDGLEVDDPIVKVRWRGQQTSAQFSARVTAEVGSRIVGKITLLLKGVPIGSGAFTITVSERSTGETQRVKLSRYRKAFLSYASPDRVAVLNANQLLRTLGIEVFQDILSLEPGERWERSLYRRIDEADLFLLYWSSAAAASDWVKREAEYALERQRVSPTLKPDIVPVLLEGPPPPPVPKSLDAIHFNDPVRYVIAAEIGHRS